jgi:thioredoxin reductase (NADPH)
MNVTNEDKYFQMGVSYCINCDGKLAKDKNVLVVGDNKLAIAGAIFLSKKCECKSVGLICQTQFNNDSLSLIKDLPIKTYEQCQVIQVNGGSYNVVGITANYQNKVIDIPTDYIFVELGTIPATSFVQDLDIIDPIKKTINVNDKYQTTTSGLFAIGDVIRTHEQSVQNAVTDARIVAKSIDHYIKNEFKLPTK